MLTPEEVTPHGSRVLVRRYEKPEKVGSIYLNPAWRQDNSRSLWEVVKVGPKAEEVLGMRLRPDWIVVTPPNYGVHVSVIDLGVGVDAFFIYAEDIQKVIPFDASEDEA